MNINLDLKTLEVARENSCFSCSIIIPTGILGLWSRCLDCEFVWLRCQ